MASPPRKRKIVTYGRQSNRTYGGCGDHFGDPFDDEPAPKRRSTSPHRLSKPRKPTVSSKTPLEELDSGIGVFDIPSSDDEPASIPIPDPPRGKLAKVAKQPAARSRQTGSAQQTQSKKATAIAHPNKRQRMTATDSQKARKTGTEKVDSQSDLDCTAKPAEKTAQKAVSQDSSLSKKRQPVTPRKKATGKDSKAPARGLSTPPSEVSSSIPRPTSSRSVAPSTPRNAPALASRPATPSTPRISSKQSTPSTLRRPATTPRQSRLWSGLLQASDSEATPNGRLKKLSLDYDKELPRPASTTETPRKRRLVDALKEAQVPSSDDFETADDSVTDVEMGNAAIDAQNHLDHVARSQQPTQAPLAGPSVGHKNTYGGSRSYLEEQAQSLEELLAQPLEVIDSPPIAQPKMSVAMHTGELRTNDDFDKSDDDDTAGKGMRSIHELRAAGGRSAFQRDMEALADEIRSDNVTRKRNAGLDLCKKLMDGAFQTRFIQAGHGTDMLRALSITKDPLTLASTAILVIALLDSDAAFVDLSGCLDDRVVDTLVVALAEERDLVSIAKDRKTNMSKLAQTSVTGLKAKLLMHAPLKAMNRKQLSPRSFALRALELLVRKLRESGNLRDPFLSPAMLARIASILSSGLARSTVVKQSKLESSELDMGLSIIESCSLSPGCVADKSTWSPVCLTRIIESLQLLFESDCEQSLQLLALRFMINMTNSSERNASFFAQEAMLGALLAKITGRLDAFENDNIDPSHLDLLLLALGGLTNLAECSKAVRTILSENHDGQLRELLRRFVNNRKKAADADSLEATQVNIAYGYLAIFLGHCCQTKALRDLVQGELPGKRLDMIIDAVEEFVRHNQETDKRAGSDAYASLTERLRSVVEILRSLEDRCRRS